MNGMPGTIALATASAPTLATPSAPLLVLAVGNPSRGDDAFGPLLAEQLLAWLATQAPAWQNRIEVIVEQQLMVEHVFDLQGRACVLFIDAAAQGDADTPVLTPVRPSGSTTVQSHACSPTQLLALHAHLLGQAPPPAALLSIAGQGFGLGEPPSPRMQAAMPQAWQALMVWIAQAA